MRIIGEIANTSCKITLFHWNNRYLIKLEKDYLEQTFKVNQFDVSSEKDIINMIDERFISEAISRFDSMEHSLSKALQNL